MKDTVTKDEETKVEKVEMDKVKDDEVDENSMGETDDFEMDESELLPRRSIAGTGHKSYDSWHETSETEIAFNGDHGENDEILRPPVRIDDQPSVEEDEPVQQESPEPGLRAKFRRARHAAGKVVNNERFQLFIVFLITINAIMMGLATFDFVKDNPTTRDAFETTDKAFLIVFSIELGMQFLYHGIYLFKDSWLVFDFIIVVVSWAFDSLQIIRAFRIFRALRLITRVEVLRKLVVALFDVMPRMCAIMALLLLIFYIYAVLCTYLFKDLYAQGVTDQDYFSRLDWSLFTLFQIMTLEDWGSIARQVMVVDSWAWLVFVSYVAVTSFIVYNLIIAVVCDAVAVIEHVGDAPAELYPDCQEQIMELNERLDDLAQQQKELLKMIQEVVQEFEEESTDEKE